MDHTPSTEEQRHAVEQFRNTIRLDTYLRRKIARDRPLLSKRLDMIARVLRESDIDMTAPMVFHDAMARARIALDCGLSWDQAVRYALRGNVDFVLPVGR